MKRFDKKGMMIYPNPKKKESPCRKEKVLVVEECYCQAGHSLISGKVKFDGFSGILFKVKRAGQVGLVALSPVYGCDHRISLDLELTDGEIYDFHCQTLSIMVAVPMPPPTHRLTSAVLRSRRSSSSRTVPRIIVPVAPNG